MIPESDLPECETCGGTGRVVPNDGLTGRAPVIEVESPCPSCGGNGHMDPDEYAEQCDEAKADRWRDHCDMIGVDP